MADKIRGITVEIGAKADSLQNVLKQVNKEVKTTQQSLKEVDKLLKFDPKNTTLLKEKQSLLNKEIENTKKKLDAMKQAQKEAAQMLANGEIDQGQYDRLTKDIEKTEKALQNLEAEAADTESKLKITAEQIGEGFQKAGQKVEDMGKKLAAVSAAAAAGLGAAVKETADFDAEMSKVQAISGATGEDFDALRNKAREMGAQTKFSASEAGSAMEYMAMAGWKTEDMLDGVEGIMNLAAASGSDLATTSDIVTDALTAMGYSSKEAGHLADVMAAASSNANTNVQMMGETFKYAAAVGGSYGYTMEDVALATGLMANSGIKGSQAGTALRSIMSRLATDAGASSKKLGALGTLTERLGVAFYNADGTMRPFRDVIADTRKKWGKLTQAEQANYASTIAGKNAMTGWLALMNSADDDFDKLASAIDNSTGTAQAMADVMQDNLKGQLTILKSQLSELAISIGDTLMPTIRKAVGYAQEAVDWVNKLDDSTKEAITTAALVVAALSPVLIIGGKLIKGIGSLIIAGSKLYTWITTGLNGPIVLAAAGIAALVGATISWRNELSNTRKAHAQFSDEQQELVDRINSEADAWKAATDARKEAYTQTEETSKAHKELWKQLEKLVDAQGKVIEGHEEEAQAIIDQLNDALGTNIELVKGQVKNYNALKESIDEVIKRKQAEALLEADSENYTKALLHHDEVARQVADAEYQVLKQEEKVAEQTKKAEEAQRKYNQAKADANDETGAMAATVEKLYKEWQLEQKALEGDTENLANLREEQQKAEKTLNSYNATLTNHDKLLDSVANGSIEDMNKAMNNLVNNVITAEKGSKKALEQQTRDFLDEYAKQREIVQSTGSQEAKTASYNMAQLVNTSIAELRKLDPKLADEMQKELNTINSKSQAWNRGGVNNANNYVSGVNNNMTGLKVEEKMKAAMDLKSKAATWGKDMMQSYASSISANSSIVKKAAAGAAKTIEKYLGFSEPEEGPLSDFHTYGPDMMALLAKGIDEYKYLPLQAAQGVAASLRQGLEGTTLTAQLDQTSIPLGAGVTLNIANFNNYSDSDIRELTNEIMETAASFAQRKGAVFA